MRFKVGQKVRVIKPYSGSEFSDGDIVEIVRIGTEDGETMNCYGAVTSPAHYMWYLYEDEVAPLTNADKIRSMTDEELAEWLEYEGGGACAEVFGWLDWLKQPAEWE